MNIHEPKLMVPEAVLPPDEILKVGVPRAALVPVPTTVDLMTNVVLAVVPRAGTGGKLSALSESTATVFLVAGTVTS